MFDALTRMLPSTKLQDTGCTTKGELRSLSRQQFKHHNDKQPNRLQMLIENLSNLPGIVVGLRFPIEEFSPPLQDAYKKGKARMMQIRITLRQLPAGATEPAAQHLTRRHASMAITEQGKPRKRGGQEANDEVSSVTRAPSQSPASTRASVVRTESPLGPSSF